MAWRALTEADLGSLFWAAFFIAALSRVVVNSWHGLNPLRGLYRWLKHPLVAFRTKAPQTVDINE